MGTFEKGILGGFSGKVGTVIGGNWKGIDYMRSRGRNTKAPTEDQLSQRLKFGVAIRFVGSMNALVEITFKNFAIKKTGINSALSYLLQNAIVGSYPSFIVKYSDVLISRGDLPNVLAPTATAGAGGIVTFNWDDNSGTGIAKATDMSILAVYCPTFNQCIYTTGSALRSAGLDVLNVSTFAGEVVETYIGFTTADGKKMATSLYTGEITIL